MQVVFFVITQLFAIPIVVKACDVGFLEGNILGCITNETEITDLGPTVPVRTECIVAVKGRVTRFECDGTRWTTVEDIKDDTIPLLRRKRGWLRRAWRRTKKIFKCVISVFTRCGRRSDKMKPVFTTCPLAHATAEPFQINERVYWVEPKAQDDRDGTLTPRRYGKGPGKHFPNGTTDVVYVARDRAGNEARCTVKVTVKVITCPDPVPIENGYYYCHPSTAFVLEGWCRYGCYEGYEMVGDSIRTCLNSEQWSSVTPWCKPFKCDEPAYVQGATVSCTNGRYFRSICTYSCSDGYDMPRGVSKTIVCSKDKRWKLFGQPTCIDVEPPSFSYCPSTILTGTDVASNTSKVSWVEPMVDDNSEGPVDITMKEGYEQESRLLAGTYKFVFGATDEAGNSARDCTFDIIVRDVKCGKLYPTPYVRISCPFGFRTGSLCNFTCDPGKTMVGNDIVRCQDGSGGLYGFWNWQNNQQTTCVASRACLAIPPPANGAIVCDNWLGGELCQAQCREGMDMGRGSTLGLLHVCQTNGDWFPPTNIRSCKVSRRGSTTAETYAYYFFSGDCTDPATQREIAENFIVLLENEKTFINMCNHTGCHPLNVHVTCGEVSKKRSIDNSMELSIVARYTMENNDDPFTTASGIIAAMKMIAQYDIDILFGNVTVVLVDFESGVNIQCPAGHMRSEQSLNCVPCPEGTFYTVDTDNQPDCVSCPKGTYQHATGQSECLRCAEGYTTRNIGVTTAEECEDACPPGSSSVDGMYPCTPCELGAYADAFGKTKCQSCPGSMSTFTYGSVSVNDCKEFDIVCPSNYNGTVNLYFPGQKTLSTSYSMSSWIQLEQSTGSSMFQPAISFTMYDQNDAEIWTFQGLTSFVYDKMEQSRYSSFDIDSRWHNFMLRVSNCSARLYMDETEITAEMNNGAPVCEGKSASRFKLAIDGDIKVKFSQTNIWNGDVSLDVASSCFAGADGDVVSWKDLADAEFDGLYTEFQSQCDDFDNCLSSPCHHGNCTDAINGFKCDCEVGYSGDDCGINIDDCVVNVCINNGTCTDGIANYTCSCPPLYTGRFCEIEMANGGWSAWSDWTECSTTCGSGVRHRKRLCNNPNPDNGGEYCQGSGNESSICETGEHCPVCEELDAPVNGTINCTNNDGALSCSIQCDDEFDFDIEPLPVYECGPDTFHYWNFESSFNTQKRLPRCVEIRRPTEIAAHYSANYKNLYCANNDMSQIVTNTIRDQITTIAESVTCVTQSSCSVNRIEIRNCDISYTKRRKRTTHEVGFQITLSVKPGETDINETLAEIENGVLALKSMAEDGQFVVDVLADYYDLDLNQTNIETEVVCGSGQTEVNYYCVGCGAGTYYNGDFCQMCGVGTYQNMEGQTSCKACPSGQTTDGEGAPSMDDCFGDTDIEEGLKIGAIVGGILAAMAIIGLVLLLYRRHRSIKQQKVDDLFTRDRAYSEYNNRECGPANKTYRPGTARANTTMSVDAWPGGIYPSFRPDPATGETKAAFRENSAVSQSSVKFAQNE